MMMNLKTNTIRLNLHKKGSRSNQANFSDLLTHLKETPTSFSNHLKKLTSSKLKQPKLNMDFIKRQINQQKKLREMAINQRKLEIKAGIKKKKQVKHKDNIFLTSVSDIRKSIISKTVIENLKKNRLKIDLSRRKSLTDFTKKTVINVNGRKIELIQEIKKERKKLSKWQLEERSLKKSWFVFDEEKKENRPRNSLRLNRIHLKGKRKPSSAKPWKKSNYSKNGQRVWRIMKKREEDHNFGIKGALRLKKEKYRNRLVIEAVDTENSRAKTADFGKRIQRVSREIRKRYLNEFEDSERSAKEIMIFEREIVERSEEDEEEQEINSISEEHHPKIDFILRKRQSFDYRNKRKKPCQYGFANSEFLGRKGDRRLKRGGKVGKRKKFQPRDMLRRKFKGIFEKKKGVLNAWEGKNSFSSVELFDV